MVDLVNMLPQDGGILNNSNLVVKEMMSRGG
ncbi:hypothetical protein A2U01_0106206 [Trifolium medium]|uniref:Uncharacterized protein n=1 Tax=Trifolium medium TaxID=97028 RepID=A0A392V9D2_9FABA|nr:hypothetical protein [Trifolium medium]